MSAMLWLILSVPRQVWTAERSVQLGMAVSSMLKGYTTTAAQIITAMLKSVTKFTIQVGPQRMAALAPSLQPWCPGSDAAFAFARLMQRLEQ
jgi:hypothetical protein